MLQRTYEIQTQLNTLVSMPREAPGIKHRIQAAMLTEIGEALQEAKPAWAWWHKGDEAAPNGLLSDAQRMDVAEELIDVWFFFMSYLDVLVHDSEFLSRDRNSDAFLEMLGSSIPAQALELFEELQAIGPIEQITVESLRSLSELAGSEQIMAEDLMNLLGRLVLAFRSVGVTYEGIWGMYLAKAVINLRRWIASSAVNDADAAQELLAELMDLDWDDIPQDVAVAPEELNFQGLDVMPEPQEA